MKKATRAELLEALREVLKRLDPQDGGTGQVVLYADCLHPEDDEKTFTDYIKEVVIRA
jgi:hypothetical protein